jgi:hypothetical protein
MPSTQRSPRNKQLERILRGREGKAHRWGEDLRRATAKTRDGRMTDPELAAQRVELARRERARAARLNALQPSNVQTEPIPF